MRQDSGERDERINYPGGEGGGEEGVSRFPEPPPNSGTV